MKPFAVMSAAFCAIAWAAVVPAEAQNAKLCDKPRQMEGFKTCADIDKAKAEGAFVLYSTDPEQGQVKLLASFNKVFPKIKTSYVRLQAGAPSGLSAQRGRQIPGEHLRAGQDADAQDHVAAQARPSLTRLGAPSRSAESYSATAALHLPLAIWIMPSNWWADARRLGFWRGARARWRNCSAVAKSSR